MTTPNREQTTEELKEQIISKLYVDLNHIEGEELLDQLIDQAFEDGKKAERERIIKNKSTRPKNKVECDCPCKSPFCSNLIHQCDQPDKHYSQREALMFDFEDQAIAALTKE